MAVTSMGGHVWVKNLKNSPVLLQCSQKFCHETPPLLLKGGGVHVSMFLLLPRLYLVMP